MKNCTILTPFFLDKPVPGLMPLHKAGWQVNQPSLPQGDVQTRMSALHFPLANFVADAVRNGERPVSIAGDCCAAIAVLAGIQRAGVEPLLIWFDAHGDFNTWETTPSGFLGGMPLAMIVGRGEQAMPKAVGLKSQPEKQVILSDARDLDPAERELVKNSGLIHLSKIDALIDYNIPDAPIYIHFDTDIVTSEESPAQNYPASSGPSAKMVQAVFDRLAWTRRIIAVSISTWNPDLDQGRKSETVSLSLLQTLVGEV
jgi:arginase